MNKNQLEGQMVYFVMKRNLQKLFHHILFRFVTSLKGGQNIKVSKHVVCMYVESIFKAIIVGYKNILLNSIELWKNNPKFNIF